MISSGSSAKWVASKCVHRFLEIQYNGDDNNNNNLFLSPESLHKDSISIWHSMIKKRVKSSASQEVQSETESSRIKYP